MNSISGRFAAATVSTGAIAVLLWSLPMPPADAEPSNDSAPVEHLKSLLVEHDVRYVLRTYDMYAYEKSAAEGSSSGCLHDAVEHGR